MICALILAAGRSRRMGTQKLLLPLGGQTVIRRVANQVLRSGVDRVFAVTGPDSTDLRAALEGLNVCLVTNPDPESEMLDSVRCGLRALPQECTAVLVIPGDQAGITAAVVTAVVHASRRTQRGLVVPTCRGRLGHPLMVSMRYQREILERYDKVGLRGLLHAHPEDVFGVETGPATSQEDMDTPEDYSRLKARFESFPGAARL